MARDGDLAFQLLELALRMERLRAALRSATSGILTDDERVAIEAALEKFAHEGRLMEEELRKLSDPGANA